MGAGGDDMASRASNSGIARYRTPAYRWPIHRPSRECDYANEIDPHHGGVGCGRCCARGRCGTNGRGPGDCGSDDQRVTSVASQVVPAGFHGGGFHGGHYGGGYHGGFRGFHVGWAPVGLALGLGSSLVAVNDDGGSGSTRHRFRHHFGTFPLGETRAKSAVWLPDNG